MEPRTTKAKRILLFAIMIFASCIQFIGNSAIASGEAVHIGDTVILGSYEIDNNPEDGREPITWLVLDIKDDKALLLSQSALDNIQYNAKEDITWESSFIRVWLNKDFFVTAFTADEQNAIKVTDVSNAVQDGNSEWSTLGGNTTQDHVFLLSHKEVNEYFASNDARRALPTAYAKDKGAYELLTEYCSWWLRSPGSEQIAATYVYASGSMSSAWASDKRGIRPAMWYDLSATTSDFPYTKYGIADTLFKAGKHEQAKAIYDSLGDFNNSTVMSKECQYTLASKAQDSKEYDVAIELFSSLDGYSDSTQRIDECRYLLAKAAQEAGDYEKAISLFRVLGDYSDSVNMIKTCYRMQAQSFEVHSQYNDAYRMYAASDNYVPIGGIVSFGVYEQDNDTTNGTEAIEWIVIASDNTRMLLISQNVLDYRNYNSERDDVVWETSNIRAWLNESFINAAFTKPEQKAITRSSIKNVVGSGNPEWPTICGNDTNDRVFLLSYQDVLTYFVTSDARRAVPSKYAGELGANRILNDNTDWWLRSSGKEQYAAVCVNINGSCDSKWVSDSLGIRPAFWFDITSDMGMYDEKRYNYALSEKKAGNYASAVDYFDILGDYADSVSQAQECRYLQAKEAQSSGYYDLAIRLFTALTDYLDSPELLEKCYYAQGQILEKSGEYEAAHDQYMLAGDSIDARTKVQEMTYQIAKSYLRDGDNESAISYFEQVIDYSDSKYQLVSIGDQFASAGQYQAAESVYLKLPNYEAAAKGLYILGQQYEESTDFEHATICYQAAGDYEDAQEKAIGCTSESTYQKAEVLMDAGDYKAAKILYDNIPGYKNADKRAAEAKKKTTATFKITASAQQVSNDHVGKKWHKWFYLNGQEIPANKAVKLELSIGDVIEYGACVEESDKNPEEDSFTESYTITQEDLSKGFTLLYTLFVYENGGRYSGNCSEWTIKFAFKK